jgi:hypothetical protein
MNRDTKIIVREGLGIVSNISNVPVELLSIGESSGGKIGVLQVSPAATFDINGSLKAATLQLTTGASVGYVPISDVNGNLTLTSPPWISSLSGAVLVSQVSPQTIGDTTNRLTKLWVLDITCTNAISGSVTGNAGTVTGLTLASGKTLTVNNILTFAGTDSTTMTFPTTSATLARVDAFNAFTPSTVIVSHTGVAIPLTKAVCEVETDGDSDLDNGTLANGNVGQVIDIYVKIIGNAADTFKITPATMLGGTNITFRGNPLGKGARLVYTSFGWAVVGVYGDTSYDAATATMTNKTLTSPRIGTAILDTNGNELIILTATGSAVNEITIANGATTANATITASGETNTGITITGKGTKGVAIGNAFTQKVVTVNDGAGFVIDASLGNEFRISAAADRTAGTPTNPIDGQRIIIAFLASGAARTLTLPTAGNDDFAFGSDITALTQTASGKIDLIGCKYNVTARQWHVIAYAKGY